MILRWLISAIGLAALKGEASTLARNVGRRAAVVVLLALVWVTAIGFALGSLTVWLSHEFGVVAACGIIAAGLAVIGLGVQLAVVLSARRKPSGGFKFPLDEISSNGSGTPLPGSANLSAMAVVARTDCSIPLRSPWYPGRTQARRLHRRLDQSPQRGRPRNLHGGEQGQPGRRLPPIILGGHFRARK